MIEIPSSQLAKAETHLRSIVESRVGLRERDVDWRVITAQLSRLETALVQDNGSKFTEAFAMLKSRLNPANVMRGEIGAEPVNKSPMMPLEVLELINHLVHTIHLELNQQPSPPPKDEEKK